jgi:3-methyl-2-oxobutanoate hydroxymethyltransferase
MTAPGIRAMKAKGQRIVCVTAYDYPSASVADASGVDLVLVGDSLGNVVLGYENTIPVSLEEMEHHTRAARRGVKEALFVADLPFGSYQSSVALAVESSVRLMKAGAEAVKLEGAYTDAIRAIVKAGIPVMGHVGMTPQSVNAFGGFRVQGKGEDGKAVREAACCVQEAGAFAIVLELMPATLARQITSDLEIPTIGIGAGPDCDGEIQVFHDVMGLSPEVFRHSKDYVGARSLMSDGLRRYAEEVRGRKFPTEENSF